MGKSHGADSAGGTAPDLQSSDYLDVTKLGSPDAAAADDKGKNKHPLAGLGAALAQAGAQMDQAPPQNNGAGPQMNQVQQAPMTDMGQPLNYLDAYRRNQMYGNSFYGE